MELTGLPVAHFAQMRCESGSGDLGCQEPLDPALENLRPEYRANPLETYNHADAEKRRKLHRIFWSEIELLGIQEGAAAIFCRFWRGFVLARRSVRRKMKWTRL